MGRYSTAPTLYDNCLTLSISKLKQWKYIGGNQIKYGRINWHRHTVDTSSLLAKYYIILHSTQNITIQGRANIVEINYKGDTNIESALKTFKNDLKKACLI